MSDYNIMSQRQKADLDNYITGHGGEDQLRVAPTIREMVLRALSDVQPQTKADLARRLELTGEQVGHALQHLRRQGLAAVVFSHQGTVRRHVWYNTRLP